MNRLVLRTLRLLALMLLPAAARAQTPPDPLAWDAVFKEITAKPGEGQLPFFFTVTNVSAGEVVITQVLTSCGCTVAKLPQQPWRLAAGASGRIEASINLTGKFGVLVKTLTAMTSAGTKVLTIKVNAPLPSRPEPEAMARARNQQLAAADRQAVFRNDCARCHLEPAWGKTGGELFVAVCGVCHEAAHRASMVPDLRTVNKENDPEIWRKFIQHGKAGTLMPAFDQSDGGPLSTAQLDSLVAYLTGRLRD